MGAFRQTIGISVLLFTLTNIFIATRSLYAQVPTVVQQPLPLPAVEPRTQRWIVITTIQAPTPQVLYLCGLPDWTTVIVADAKTPLAPWVNVSTGCIFLSMKDQEALGYQITKLIPRNNYGRKNVGYLYAIEHGAREIYETDDDNQPATRMGGVALHKHGEPVARLSGEAVGLRVQNPYAFFGLPDIWPRGYPLKDVNKSRLPHTIGCSNDAPLLHADMEFPVQQGIVDLDADVDAIFRMTYAPYVGKVKFRTDRVPVSLARGTYCPYNTQNTVSRYKAFWGLLVPVTTTMRVCDIWRSYWVQRVLWDIGEELLFLPATAEQVRNPHDFHRDFMEELDLYTKAGDLIDTLNLWDPPISDLFGRIKHLGHVMADRSFWGVEDALLMEAWLNDLIHIGYIPPRLVTTPADPPPEAQERGCAPSPFPAEKRFALYVRAFSNPKHVDEFWVLVRSMDIFFPGFRHGRYDLIVVLDDESAGDHAFGAEILVQVPTARVYYEPPAPAQYHNNGHVRQQWSMFWGDNYTIEYDYVAFIDTDVIFNTPVTTDLLFDATGRPRVKAVIDRRPASDNFFWASIPKNTQQWLGGLPEVFRGMSYFPVIFWREDLARIRRHVEFVHGAPFNTVFRQLALPATFSQFNIMLNILYYTRTEAYAWNIQLYDANSMTTKPHPGQLSAFSYDRFVPIDSPCVRGTLHLTYLHDDLKNQTADAFLREGYCAALGRPQSRDSLFQFDASLHTTNPGAAEAQEAHLRDITKTGYVFSQRQRTLATNSSVVTVLCMQ